MTARRVGVFGGTLDPIHLGHLKAAEAAREALELSEVLLIPARVPPHRQVEPVVSAYHRFAMVALAVADHPAFIASDLEMDSAGPSYTSATLRKLHARGLSPVELFFIAGRDAFAEIATWKEYPGLFDLSHFVVVDRPGGEALSLEALASRFPELRGRLVVVKSPRTSSSSGSAARGRKPETRVFLLRAETPDVSSSEIRRRLAAGEPIEGLVPGAVARHIARHGLYGV
ncbi:MAG: nicotinate (nicotinamide) nucleotide adenylyltransferase, partial [Acidobacteria bacterium]|nr:nicotinate (nicotinamide) nucleotide adenylyltransferase [Acidobacteriota bacterium]